MGKGLGFRVYGFNGVYCGFKWGLGFRGNGHTIVGCTP